MSGNPANPVDNLLTVDIDFRQHITDLSIFCLRWFYSTQIKNCFTCVLANTRLFRFFKAGFTYRVQNNNKENNMDGLINQLVSKVGIDKATAEKVVNFLKENADQVPKWLGSAGIADKLPGMLGGMFGGDKDKKD